MVVEDLGGPAVELPLFPRSCFCVDLAPVERDRHQHFCPAEWYKTLALIFDDKPSASYMVHCRYEFSAVAGMSGWVTLSSVEEAVPGVFDLDSSSQMASAYGLFELVDTPPEDYPKTGHYVSREFEWT